jgi:hypothetical protein
MKLLTVAAITLSIVSARAATVIAATWNTPTNGIIKGISFTVTGLSSPYLAVEPGISFSGPDFAAAPLMGVEAIQYGATNDWTTSFAGAPTDLAIYANFWRGIYSVGDDPDTHYTFSRPFSILSGFAGATVSGNTLTLPAGEFYSSIISFSGPMVTLSVVSDGNSESGQLMTFATPVPEHILTLFGLGALVITGRLVSLWTVQQQVRKVRNVSPSCGKTS